MKYVKSPLNYTGGKYKLLEQLIPLFPQDINTFVDMFAGGCNVGINVDSKKVVFNDIATPTIEMYKEFQKIKNFEDLNRHVEMQIEAFSLSKENSEGYTELRKHYNEYRNPLDLFVLCCYSFNNIIRFNSKLEFNTSFGLNRSSYNESISDNLFEFLNSLNSKDVIFTNYNFQDYDISTLDENDFVYLDPPYLITTAPYNTMWSETEEHKLLDFMETLNSKKIRYALSNVLENKGNVNEILMGYLKSNTYLVTNYLNIDYSNSSYNIKDKTEGTTVEVLITNYAPPLPKHEPLF